MQYLCNQLRGVCGAVRMPTHIGSLYCVHLYLHLLGAFFIYGDCKEKKQAGLFLGFRINTTPSGLIVQSLF